MKRAYKVKIKDHNQNTTHSFTEQASSKNEANSIAIERLRKILGYPPNSTWLEIK